MQFIINVQFRENSQLQNELNRSIKGLGEWSIVIQRLPRAAASAPGLGDGAGAHPGEDGGCCRRPEGGSGRDMKAGLQVDEGTQVSFSEHSSLP